MIDFYIEGTDLICMETFSKIETIEKFRTKGLTYYKLESQFEELELGGCLDSEEVLNFGLFYFLHFKDLFKELRSV